MILISIDKDNIFRRYHSTGTKPKKTHEGAFNGKGDIKEALKSFMHSPPDECLVSDSNSLPEPEEDYVA
jgi:hypothetical protein